MDPAYSQPAPQPPAMAPPDIRGPHRFSILTCGLHDARGCAERVLDPDRRAAKVFGYARLSDVPAAHWPFHPESITCDTCNTSLSALCVQRAKTEFCTTCWLKELAQNEGTLMDYIDHGTDKLCRLLDVAALARLTNATGIRVCALLARDQYMAQLAATPTGAADQAHAMCEVQELEELLAAWSTRRPPAGTTEPLVIHMDEIRASRVPALAKILGCLASGYPVKVVGLDVDSDAWHPRCVLKGSKTVGVVDKAVPEWFYDEDAATTQLNPAQFAHFYDQNAMVKVSDYPGDKTLQVAAPDNNEAFICSMLNLIAPELMNPKGIFNMGRVLTTFVDIVAKYYASGGEDSDATTGLHTDPSEACNVLVHGAPAWWYFIPEWHREAANTILRERYSQFPEFPDPIGARFIRMTSADIDALRERGVTVWEVKQSVGEAIVVPFECAHQVFNTGANAKIATDMVLMCSIDRLLDRQQALREKTRLGEDLMATTQLVLRALDATLCEVCELAGMTEALEEPLIE